MLRRIRQTVEHLKTGEAKPPPGPYHDRVRVAVCGLVPDALPLRLEWETEFPGKRIDMTYWSNTIFLSDALEQGLDPHLIFLQSSYGIGLSPLSYADSSGRAYPVYLLGDAIPEPTRRELKQVFNEIHSKLATEVTP